MKTSILIASLLSATLVGACSNVLPGPPAGIVMTPSVKQEGMQPTKANIAYARSSDAQNLDLYLPAGNGPFPVLVYIHGGGFKFGNKEMASANLVKGFLKGGYAVASINYRLSGEAQFPAAVQDAFQAIAYLKKNAKALDLNEDQIGVYGESAGANIAALTGTAYGQSLFKQGLATSIDVKPFAVIAHYPPVDFLKIDTMLKEQSCPGRATHDSADSFESKYMGGPLPSIPEKVAQANPANYASSHATPFFIQNGSHDCAVGSGQARLLVKALEQNGASVSYEQISGAQHGGPEFETAGNLEKMLDFLRNARDGKNAASN